MSDPITGGPIDSTTITKISSNGNLKFLGLNLAQPQKLTHETKVALQIYTILTISLVNVESPWDTILSC